MASQFSIFSNKSEQSINYNGANSQGRNKTFTLSNSDQLLASNGIYPFTNQNWYNRINRFSWVDVYDNDDILREYLFFTKPNLYIYGDGGSQISYSNAWSDSLQDTLKTIPYFVHEADRHKDALCQLQYNVTDRVKQCKTPFMYLLTNAVQSKLDLPTITPTDSDSTENEMGISLKYRGHSLKSDAGHDFSLTFLDTADLEVYTLVKAYDEYIRLLKVGDISYRDSDVINHIIPEMFSIYKFLIRSDGETIAYWAKLTGCYFADVPRSDMSDPNNEGGFKFAVNFHASFVEDMNPLILSEFYSLTKDLAGQTSINKEPSGIAPTYNMDLGRVDNRWCSTPCIVRYNDARAKRHSGSEETKRYNDYRLRFTL